MEIILLLLVAVAIFAVAAVAFCWWIAAVIVRGIWHAIAPRARTATAVDAQACANADCRCANPAHARFCRRCGRSLPALLRAIASRAAML